MLTNSFQKPINGMASMSHADLKSLKNIATLFLRSIVNRRNGNISPISRPFSSSSSTTAEDISDEAVLLQALPGLKAAQKIRVNQLSLTRIGMKPAKKESLRSFEVVNVENGEKLIFAKLHHSTKVEVFGVNLFKFSQDNSPSGSSLMRSGLERNAKLHTIASRIYSCSGRPIAYIYDLEGVRRTAIIENGAENKCLYQLQTKTPGGWTHDARIYSGNGKNRLGHFTKLDGFNRDELMIYLRIHHELDVQSKCLLTLSAIYLVTLPIYQLSSICIF